MCVCLLCLCVHHMHTVPAFESEEYIVFPESGVERVVLGLTWVLGTQVVLSARAASALNPWAITLAPILIFQTVGLLSTIFITWQDAWQSLTLLTQGCNREKRVLGKPPGRIWAGNESPPVASPSNVIFHMGALWPISRQHHYHHHTSHCEDALHFQNMTNSF